MKQKTSITDFFKSYPYKKKDVSGTGGIFYIPKYELVEDHKFSITRTEYLEITKVFFDVLLFEFLIWGNIYKMPHKFGSLLFRKCKDTSLESRKKNIDFGETRRLYGKWNKENPNDKKVIYHKNYHSQGYGVYIVWDKKDAFFGNKYAMNFTLARRQMLKVTKYLKENIKLINYINEY